jgi:hypothetical protein
LYRLEEFFFEKDIELLIGSDVEPSRFSDYNLARVLDKIYETGTQKVFSAIAVSDICNEKLWGGIVLAVPTIAG